MEINKVKFDDTDIKKFKPNELKRVFVNDDKVYFYINNNWTNATISNVTYNNGYVKYNGDYDIANVKAKYTPNEMVTAYVEGKFIIGKFSEFKNGVYTIKTDKTPTFKYSGFIRVCGTLDVQSIDFTAKESNRIQITEQVFTMPTKNLVTPNFDDRRIPHKAKIRALNAEVAFNGNVIAYNDKTNVYTFDADGTGRESHKDVCTEIFDNGTDIVFQLKNNVKASAKIRAYNQNTGYYTVHCDNTTITVPKKNVVKEYQKGATVGFTGYETDDYFNLMDKTAEIVNRIPGTHTYLCKFKQDDLTFSAPFKFFRPKLEDETMVYHTSSVFAPIKSYDPVLNMYNCTLIGGEQFSVSPENARTEDSYDAGSPNLNVMVLTCDKHVREVLSLTGVTFLFQLQIRKPTDDGYKNMHFFIIKNGA